MVDEHYLPRVSVGQTVTTEIDARTYRLALGKVYPQVRDRLFKVELLVPEGTASSLRRGQSLQMRLQLGGSSHCLLVANGPFYDDNGGQWAFVLAPGQNVALRRPVTLGRRNPEQVEVLQGLTPGDRVIVSSYESFRGAERIALTAGEL
jgi:HlyD family secretion protein